VRLRIKERKNAAFFHCIFPVSQQFSSAFCPSSIIFLISQLHCVYVCVCGAKARARARTRARMCVAECCKVQCVAVCCSVLQCGAVCIVLQYVAVCCSMLQCVAVCCSVLREFACVHFPVSERQREREGAIDKDTERVCV